MWMAYLDILSINSNIGAVYIIYRFWSNRNLSRAYNEKLATYSILIHVYILIYFTTLKGRHSSEEISTRTEIIYLFIYLLSFIQRIFHSSMLKCAVQVMRWHDTRAHRPAICTINRCTHYVQFNEQPLLAEASTILDRSLSHTYAHSAIMVSM